MFRIIYFLSVFAGLGKCNFGGHDLFTSLAQLEELWKDEIRIVGIMKDTLSAIDILKRDLEAYVQNHVSLGLNKSPNYGFLGHPLNSYHFIRHVAMGWKWVRGSIFSKANNTTLEENLQALKERERKKLPDFDDIKGASYGLVRLYSLYKFDLSSFVHEGVIAANLSNGDRVKSSPSVLKINSFDLQVMGEEAKTHGLMDACTDVLTQCLRKSKEELARKETFPYLSHVPNPSKHLSELRTAKKIHDQLLEKKGMMTRSHRTHQYPFDPVLKKKKKFRKPFSPGPLILDRSSAEAIMKDPLHKNRVTVTTEYQAEKLCRGDAIRDPGSMAKLKCIYGHGGSEWLRLGPLKIEVQAEDPFIVVIRELLFEHECDNVTKYLGPYLDFPPGRMRVKSIKNDWTMKNCWPNENDHAYLDKLNRRIEHLSGLKAAANQNHSEPFMCGNYGIGGYYWTHPDYHEPSPQTDFLPEATGNRIATVMTVLEAPEAGGATVWPYVGVSIFPEKGSGAFWFNLFSDAHPDTFTRHTACPVLLGQKWIGNKWIGYNAQWAGRNCHTKRKLPFSESYD